MQELKRLTIVNAIFLTFISIGIGTYVLTLEVEMYYALVFMMYLLYGAAMLLFANCLGGFVTWWKRGFEEAKPFFLTGILSSISAGIIGILGAQVIKLLL